MAMTFTYHDSPEYPVKKIVCDWTSDADGDAAATTKKVRGRLIKGVTDPSATAPTDNYDIVITDEESFNVLTNCGDDLADRDTANTEEVYFLVTDGTTAIAVHPAVNDALTITVSNAGNAKSGQFILYYEGSSTV